MTGAEAKKLSNDEIKVEVKRLREKLFQLRVQRETEKVENTAQFKALRKDLARVLTERTSRRHAAAPAKPAAKPAKSAKPAAAKPAAKKKAASK
jgi:large subunit ribosomal protein L29